MGSTALVKIKKLLWATDFSNESTSCLPYIKAISKVLKTRNFALYVLPKFSDWVYESSVFSSEDLVGEVEKARAESYRKIERLAKSKQVDLIPRIEEGVASEEIIRVAQESQVQMIFAGRRGISEMEELLIGSTTSRLIRNSPIPVFVVPRVSRSVSLSKILVPLDLKDPELPELQYAIGLASQLKAELVVVHVAQFFNYKIPVLERDRLLGGIREKIEQVAGRKRKTIAQIIFQYGDPAQKIIETSRKQKADLIVIAAHQRKGIEKLFLGSVAEKVLMVSETPLLVLPYSHIS